MGNCQVLIGDCIEKMRELESGGFDAVVTDPPYEIGLLSKGWDRSGIAYSVELWAEVLRVLKPGGHLLSFSATRTYHRMVCAAEDAGFEVRDTLAWEYRNGMLKSRDVSLSIDNHLGATRTEVIGHKQSGYDQTTTGTTTFVLKNGQSRWPQARDETGLIPIYAPATPEASRWNGWGTRVKPQIEPILKARKPLIGTVAENVLAHGVGGVFLGSDAYPSNLIYCPKPSRFERDAGVEGMNPHPTAKPIELMRQLCRLVTPKNGLILDPFLGSGTTGIAAVLDGFSCAGIERDPAYAQVAKSRIAFWKHYGERGLEALREREQSERAHEALVEAGQEALF